MYSMMKTMEVYSLSTNKNNTEIFIHTGTPRTASTFLQLNFFPNLKGINYLPPHPFVVYFKIKPGKNLISNESLYGDNNINKYTLNHIEILDNLKTLYPNGKIIVVFREKESWKKSMYNAYAVRIQNKDKYKDFQHWFDNYFDHSQLDYDGYIQRAKELFGENNVCVLWFEDFLHNKNKFLKDMCDFMGLELPEYKDERVNASLTDRQIKFIRWISRFPYYGVYHRFTNVVIELISK